MFAGTWRKAVLTGVFSAFLLMTSAPAMALADRIIHVPDDYRVNLEMVRVQRLLSEKGFYRGPVDGLYRDLSHSILAFNKAADLERTTTLTPEGLAILAVWETQVPDIPDQPDRLEIDLARQVMHLVNEGEVVATLPVSSGNGAWYQSPRLGRWAQAVTSPGNYRIYYHIPRWRIAPLGGLYKPWYFNGGIAVHGSLFVPTWPDSHGCVRVTLDDADWLAKRLFVGMPVNVRATIERTPAIQTFSDPLGMYS